MQQGNLLHHAVAVSRKIKRVVKEYKVYPILCHGNKNNWQNDNEARMQIMHKLGHAFYVLCFV